MPFGHFARADGIVVQRLCLVVVPQKTVDQLRHGKGPGQRPRTFAKSSVPNAHVGRGFGKPAIVRRLVREVLQDLEVERAHVPVEHHRLVRRDDVAAIAETFASGTVALNTTDQVRLERAAAHLVDGRKVLVIRLERLGRRRHSPFVQGQHRSHVAQRIRLAEQMLCAAYFGVAEDVPGERRIEELARRTATDVCVALAGDARRARPAVAALDLACGLSEHVYRTVRVEALAVNDLHARAARLAAEQKLRHA